MGAEFVGLIGYFVYMYRIYIKLTLPLVFHLTGVISIMVLVVRLYYGVVVMLLRRRQSRRRWLIAERGRNLIEFARLEFVGLEFIGLELVGLEFIRLELVRLEFIRLELVRLEFIRLEFVEVIVSDDVEIIGQVELGHVKLAPFDRHVDANTHINAEFDHSFRAAAV